MTAFSSKVSTCLEAHYPICKDSGPKCHQDFGFWSPNLCHGAVLLQHTDNSLALPECRRLVCIWVVVKIMVPCRILNIIRHLRCWRPERDHSFHNHPCVAFSGQPRRCVCTGRFGVAEGSRRSAWQVAMPFKAQGSQNLLQFNGHCERPFTQSPRSPLAPGHFWSLFHHMVAMGYQITKGGWLQTVISWRCWLCRSNMASVFGRWC